MYAYYNNVSHHETFQIIVIDVFSIDTKHIKCISEYIFNLSVISLLILWSRIFHNILMKSNIATDSSYV